MHTLLDFDPPTKKKYRSMSFPAISLKFLIMIEDYPSYHQKKFWLYVRNLWGRRIVRVRLLRSSSIPPSPSVTTRSTSFVVLLVAEISKAIAASTLGRLVILLLAFWDVLEAGPDQELN